MIDHVQGDRFEVSVTDGGVLRLDLADNAEITSSDAEAALDAVALLSAGVRRPLLVDMRSVGPMKRPTRKVFARASVATRVALLVGSPVSRLVGNFALGLDRPETDTVLRVFDDEAAARRWLLDRTGSA